jgi:hypothetical protein
MSLPPRIAREVPRAAPRLRPGMSAGHLAFIRRLPCCVCGREPGGEAHHLLRVEGRGMGMKAADRWAVPLCRVHHQSLHDKGGEEAWFAARGIDARALAERLWRVSGDDQQGARASLRCRAL